MHARKQLPTRLGGLATFTSLATVGVLVTLGVLAPGPGGTAMADDSTLKLSSPAFDDGAEIPRVHTCQGEDRAPALEISGVPSGAKSLALIVTDPDAPDPAAPKTTWTHWVVYDLPPDTSALPAGGATPSGGRDALNDWGRPGYGGPCPPIGRHRYFHTLYALDEKLDDLGAVARRGDVERALADHVLAKATLMGTYEKSPEP